MVPQFSVLHAVKVGYPNLVHAFAQLVTIKTVRQTALNVLLDSIAALMAVEAVLIMAIPLPIMLISVTVDTVVPMVGQVTYM
jgi:hypothetical protein